MGVGMNFSVGPKAVLAVSRFIRRFRRPHKLRKLARRTSEHYAPAGIQLLESRFALTAEGETFALNRTFDTLSLGGDLSAQVRWGDGTTSNATVQGGAGPEKIKVRIDYSLDTNNFFTTARRQLLQSVVDSIAGKLNDSLTAIIPGGSNTWTASLIHPSTGQTVTRNNLRINANEILVFAGARAMPGVQLGEGGFGGYSGFGTPEFLSALTTRGQGTVSGAGANDFGPWGGFVSFDTTADWYFGADPSAVDSGKSDFVTTAAHEFLHLLGFGIAPSWKRLVSGNTFTGTHAKTEYDGVGNVPLQSDQVHWQVDLNDNGAETLMDPNQALGQRKSITRLDAAALKDIGWEFVTPTARVTANHVYPDNGNFVQEIILVGNRIGKVTQQTPVGITNTVPSLTVVGPQTVVAGKALSIENIGLISDPGFRNLKVTPSTIESFTYTVTWGDGSAPSNGSATIDRIGSAGITTLASFDESHSYTDPGTYTVRITVVDDDGGTTTKTFPVSVLDSPSLTLSIDQPRIVENGSVAAMLTVSRSGGILSDPLTVSLSSSDTSEATVGATVTFAANQTSVSIPVTAVDDTLLDGDQTVTFSAAAAGVISGEVTMVVADYETLQAVFSAESINEGDGPNAVRLTVTRSNTDVASPLNLEITGVDPGALELVSPSAIPEGSQSVQLLFNAVDDAIAELTQEIIATVSASGYQVPGTASLSVVDNEPPKFQNPSERYDVNNDTKLTPLDALVIINRLIRLGSSQQLDPASSSPPPFLDVSGDYILSPLDALQVINQLNRMVYEPEGEATIAASSTSNSYWNQAEPNSVNSNNAAWSSAAAWRDQADDWFSLKTRGIGEQACWPRTLG